MSNEIVQINADKIANFTGYTSEQVAIAKSTIAKGTSDSELAYFLNVAKTNGLNPFNKEVWCYKDNKNNLLVFTGRDGFLSKAQQNPAYNGIRSSEVYENDDFSLDIANAKISHLKKFKNKGAIIGAYAIVFRKNGEPTIEWADFSDYNKGYNTWKSNPAEMIKKVAESHALKKAFGISGIQSEYDFEVVENKAIPIKDYNENAQQKSDVDEIKRKLLEALEIYQGEDKEDIREKCLAEIQLGGFTAEFARKIAKNRMGVEL